MIRYGQYEQNIFIKIKRLAKHVFPSDVERTVGKELYWQLKYQESN